MKNWRNFRGAGFCLLPLMVLGFLLFASSNSRAEEKIFRLGTGGNAGSYLPIGTLIADALNQYNAAHSKGERNEPELLVLAQRSSGSAANVQEISEGLLESGLSQADVAHWAHRGTGPFHGSEQLTDLRAIATLYFESLHLVASTESRIRGVDDLSGARVSVDEVGSGTELDVLPVLNAYGLAKSDVKMVYLKPTDAIDRLRQGQLDAFFIVAGYPITGVSELVQEGKAVVVPISHRKTSALLASGPFFTLDTIPEQTYANTARVPTLAVAAQWIVNANLDDALIYQMTKALWSDSTQNILSQGHPKGREISIESALSGLGIPLHPGAEQYYRELGMTLPEIQP